MENDSLALKKPAAGRDDPTIRGKKPAYTETCSTLRLINIDPYGHQLFPSRRHFSSASQNAHVGGSGQCADWGVVGCRCKWDNDGEVLRFRCTVTRVDLGRKSYSAPELLLSSNLVRARIEIVLSPHLSTCLSLTSAKSSYSQAWRTSSERQKLQKCLRDRARVLSHAGPCWVILGLQVLHSIVVFVVKRQRCSTFKQMWHL